MKTRQVLLAVMAVVVAFAMTPVPAIAQDAGQPDPAALSKLARKPPYSPNAGRDYAMRPLWGDTHLHTSASFDAGAAGTTLGARDAYRFARGEEVISSSGQPAKLARPLDFLVVADHSDNMGFAPDLLAGPTRSAHPS